MGLVSGTCSVVAPLARGVCCFGRENFVAVREPPHPGVGPRADDKHFIRSDVFRRPDFVEQCAETPCASSTPERTQSHGVAARLGREVTAESEHPVPLVQLRVWPFCVNKLCEMPHGLLDALDMSATTAR